MSAPPQTRDNLVVEEVSLHLLPGSGETQNNGEASATCDSAPSCHDRNFRRLAYCSIICGISCIGIFALVNSVKAEDTVDPERAARLSRRSRNLSIISILTWVGLLALTPCLMALVSYLLTLKD